MAKMGDKVSARQSALDAGLPIIPGTDTALSDSEVRFLVFILLTLYNGRHKDFSVYHQIEHIVKFS